MDNAKATNRSELLRLLEDWELGVVDEREVHERAESIVDSFGDLPNYPESDPRSIPTEVLFHLDALNQQLTTRDDIPAIKAFLASPLGKELEAWAAWRSYWDNVDFEKRKRELKANPYYCT